MASMVRLRMRTPHKTLTLMSCFCLPVTLLTVKLRNDIAIKPFRFRNSLIAFDWGKVYRCARTFHFAPPGGATTQNVEFENVVKFRVYRPSRTI